MKARPLTYLFALLLIHLVGCGEESMQPSLSLETTKSSATSKSTYRIFPEQMLASPGSQIAYQVYKVSGFFNNCHPVSDLKDLTWRVNDTSNPIQFTEDKLSAIFAPINPGAYEIEVTAPDGSSLHSQLIIMEGVAPSLPYPPCL
jgi:hypothetical protein